MQLMGEIVPLYHPAYVGIVQRVRRGRTKGPEQFSHRTDVGIETC